MAVGHILLREHLVGADDLDIVVRFECLRIVAEVMIDVAQNSPRTCVIGVEVDELVGEVDGFAGSSLEGIAEGCGIEDSRMVGV